ncbi:MAG: VCBS repeat-containing protein [Bryobacteraceae bacterium]
MSQVFRLGLLIIVVSALINAAPPTPSFYGRRDYAVTCGNGLNPGQLTAAADVNGDGITDIVCAIGTKVLLGNGDGTFRNGPASGAFGGAGIATGDLNGDGKADLVFAGFTTGSQGVYGFMGISLGNGDGTFQPQVFYQTGSDQSPSAVVLGDFNRDGILDVATQGESGVWLFLGNGGGLFGSPVLLPVAQSGNAAFCLRSGDVNADGKLDLIASTQTGFTVLLGNGDGTFLPGPSASDTFQGLSSGMSVGDLNRDGRADVVVVSSLYPYVLVYLSAGAGTFATPVRVSLPGNFNVAIGDVNGDHTPDLVSDGVYVALGRGDGTFQPPIYYAVSSQSTGGGGASSVILADLRKLGRMDLVVTNFLYGNMSILLNQGNGRYNEGIWVPVSGGGGGCSAELDFNGDGKPDLAVTVTAGISLLAGTGKATKPFTQGAVLPLTNAACVFAADVNGDSIPDLVAQTYEPSPSRAGTVTIFLGHGDGTFTQKSVTPVTISGWLALGDYNHDGKLDFALSSNLLALGNGDGTFQTPIPFVPDVLPPTQVTGFTNVAAGDLNGDGISDLVLTDGNHSMVYVLLANSTGGFQQTVLNIRACYFPYLPVLADIEGNGKLDMLFGCGDSTIPILRNDGAGNFTNAGHLTFSLANSTVPLVADVNGDGIPDVVAATGADLAVFSGKGGLHFATPILYGTNETTSSILTMNLHGQTPASGKPDIVLPDTTGGLVVLLNVTK